MSRVVNTAVVAGGRSKSAVARDYGVSRRGCRSWSIWRILSRRGFVTRQPHNRPRSSWHRFHACLPNDLWQAGITHWPLAGGSNAEILNIIDDHSRLLAGSTARAVFKAGTARSSMWQRYCSDVRAGVR
jgi:hypothetical protein